ncbi:hypothetical protein [Modestobacter altitudinis]|uniref:hypothetical protein n=1 Tax=Modestobacter altitudinis TaxID=2213158 RepID=UPI00110CEEAC|nr:hypothetical protein [Modestobacter altitudinis]
MTVPAPTAARWRWVAATALLAAGGLHVAVTAEHLAAHDLVVGLALSSAYAQLGLGLWLLVGPWLGSTPGTAPLVVALAGTVLLICLYLVVHLTDLLAGITAPGAGGGTAADHPHSPGAPIDVEGPVALGGRAPSRPAPADLLGTVMVAAELVSVVGLTALLPRSWRGRALDALLAVGVLVWLGWLTGALR